MSATRRTSACIRVDAEIERRRTREAFELRDGRRQAPAQFGLAEAAQLLGRLSAAEMSGDALDRTCRIGQLLEAEHAAAAMNLVSHPFELLERQRRALLDLPKQLADAPQLSDRPRQVPRFQPRNLLAQFLLVIHRSPPIWPRPVCPIASDRTALRSRPPHPAPESGQPPAAGPSPS